ncbi:MAG: hypothetical protein K1X88_14665 [Nannocystaceae bacterium]|nr:hypothetical protein [Nannocystaceae bacterium]
MDLCRPKPTRTCAWWLTLTLAFACAPEDGGDDGGDTTSGGSDTTTGNAEGTASATGGTTAGWVDCASLQGDACESNPQCALYPSLGGCAVDCAPLDQSACEAVSHCAWNGSSCALGQ